MDKDLTDLREFMERIKLKNEPLHDFIMDNIRHFSYTDLAVLAYPNGKFKVDLLIDKETFLLICNNLNNK